MIEKELRNLLFKEPWQENDFRWITSAWKRLSESPDEGAYLTQVEHLCQPPVSPCLPAEEKETGISLVVVDFSRTGTSGGWSFRNQVGRPILLPASIVMVSAKSACFPVAHDLHL